MLDVAGGGAAVQNPSCGVDGLRAVGATDEVPAESVGGVYICR